MNRPTLYWVTLVPVMKFVMCQVTLVYLFCAPVI